MIKSAINREVLALSRMSMSKMQLTLKRMPLGWIFTVISKYNCQNNLSGSFSDAELVQILHRSLLSNLTHILKYDLYEIMNVTTSLNFD